MSEVNVYKCTRRIGLATHCQPPPSNEPIKQHYQIGILVFACLEAAEGLLVDLLLPRVVREEVRVHLSSFLLSFAVVIPIIIDIKRTQTKILRRTGTSTFTSPNPRESIIHTRSHVRRYLEVKLAQRVLQPRLRLRPASLPLPPLLRLRVGPPPIHTPLPPPRRAGGEGGGGRCGVRRAGGGELLCGYGERKERRAAAVGVQTRSAARRRGDRGPQPIHAAAERHVVIDLYFGRVVLCRTHWGSLDGRTLRILRLRSVD